MSDKHQDLIASILAAQNEEDLLWGITRTALADLSPAAEDAVYRCAVVHWFNPELIQALRQSGQRERLGRPFKVQSDDDLEQVISEILALPFLETYPEKGHNFHQLTRNAILNHLWRDEPTFLREISGAAAHYYEQKLETEAGLEWDEVVEWLYNLFLSEESMAIDQVENLMNDLVIQNLSGYADMLIRALEEHAAADRLPPGTLPILRYWQFLAAYIANDWEEVSHIGIELLAAEEEFVTVEIKGLTLKFMGFSCLHTAHYDEGIGYFTELLDLSLTHETILTLAIDALLGLGNIAVRQNQFSTAETHYFAALHQAIHDLVYIEYEDEFEGLQTFVGLPPTDELPANLQFTNPEAWASLPVYAEEDEGLEEIGEISEISEIEEELVERADGEEPVEVEPEIVNFLFLIALGDDETWDLDDEEITEENEPAFLPVLADPIFIDIWLRLGNLYQETDQYDRAASCGRLAGALADDLGQHYGVQQALQLLYTLGATVGDLQMADFGLDYQKQLLEIARETGDQSNELESLLGLAYAYSNQAESVLAREHYEAALTLARDLGDAGSEGVALEGLAHRVWVAGRLDEAVERFKEVQTLYRRLEHREGECRLLISLGSLELERYHPDQAERYFQDAQARFSQLNINRGEVDALTGLGQVARYREDYKQACLYFEQALDLARRYKLKTEEAKSLIELALIYSFEQKQERAFTLYQEALDIVQDLGQRVSEIVILVGMGRTTQEQRKYAEAKRYFDRALDFASEQNRPDIEIDIYLALGSYFRIQGQTTEALEAAEEAFEISTRLQNGPGIVSALLSMAETYQQAADYERLQEKITRVLELDPQNITGWVFKGLALTDTADYAAAIDSFDKALTIDPASAWAWGSKGWALENLGPARAADALQAYNSALQFKEDDLWALKGRGNAFRLLGRHEEAAGIYRDVIARVSTHDPLNPDDHSLLAWCHYCLGDYDLSIEHSRAFLAEDPRSLSSWFDIALCQLCRGEMIEGQALYEETLKSVEERLAPGRRGLLHVALDDLRDAINEGKIPAQAEIPIQVQKLLQTARDEAFKTASGT